MKIEVKISDAEWPAVQSMSSHLTDLLEFYADCRVHSAAASPTARTITLHATKGDSNDTPPHS